jgi:hypothetical protein
VPRHDRKIDGTTFSHFADRAWATALNEAGQDSQTGCVAQRSEEIDIELPIDGAAALGRLFGCGGHSF